MKTRQFRDIQRGLEWLMYFTRFFFRQFYQQRGLQIASSLAYATLLALVPLITVMFTFSGSLPVFENVGNTIQTYIFNNFVPEFGETILGHISSFTQKTSELTLTGLSLIFVIAVMLMGTIDNAFNSIWHVRNRRHPVARFLVYWAILTVGPILLGIGLFTSSYLLSVPLISDVDTFGLRERVLSWLPLLTSSVAFTVVYLLVPNCFVLARHAVTGGVFAALLFECAKYGFGIYVQSMAGFQTLYGALAVIPIFLIWIYTSWVVLLFGAHITFCLSAFSLVSEKTGRQDHGWSFEEAFHLIFLLWLAQKQGKSLSYSGVRSHSLKIPPHQFNEIMGYLQMADWVQGTAGSNWVLSRDMDTVTLLDFCKVIPRQLPIDKGSNDESVEPGSLGHVLRDWQNAVMENLSIPLSRLLEHEDRKTGRR